MHITHHVNIVGSETKLQESLNDTGWPKKVILK